MSMLAMWDIHLCDHVAPCINMHVDLCVSAVCACNEFQSACNEFQSTLRVDLPTHFKVLTFF